MTNRHDMETPDNTPEAELIKTGTAIVFKVIDTTLQVSTDGEQAHVEVKLAILDDDEEDGYDTVEWGAFGFIYTLAFLSFKDARPRGYSETDFVDDDYFSIADLVSCLSFKRGNLCFDCDYLRGRCIKTQVTIESNGRVVATTYGRGKALSVWLQKIQGKKVLQVV